MPGAPILRCRLATAAAAASATTAAASAARLARRLAAASASLLARLGEGGLAGLLGLAARLRRRPGSRRPSRGLVLERGELGLEGAEVLVLLGERGLGGGRGILRGLHLLLRFLLQAVALVAGDLGLVAEVLRVVAGADGVGVDARLAATSRSIVPSLASRSSALAAEPEKKSSSGVVAAGAVLLGGEAAELLGRLGRAGGLGVGLVLQRLPRRRRRSRRRSWAARTRRRDARFGLLRRDVGLQRR
jgi:hypothetical protein